MVECGGSFLRPLALRSSVFSLYDAREWATALELGSPNECEHMDLKTAVFDHWRAGVALVTGSLQFSLQASIFCSTVLSLIGDRSKSALSVVRAFGADRSFQNQPRRN